MKFVVDAQLPKRLCRLLESSSHEARHTLDLPDGNRTPDQGVCDAADQVLAVLVSKDDDFVVSHLQNGTPSKLLFVSTGNISNNDLCALFASFLSEIESAFEASSFVELTRTLLIIHE